MSKHDPTSRKTLLFAKAPGDRGAFAATVRERVIPALATVGRGPLKIDVTERPNPRLGVVPFRPENLLMVSVWGEADVAALRAALEPLHAAVFGYRVEESYPARYERTWADGTRSPGDVLLTLLAKRDRLSYDAFFHEWHGVHTPKAMRIHPLWSYARNVVKEAIVEGSPAFEGVVEEHYRSLSDITNPVRLFGGPLRFVPHLVEVGRHVGMFLDLKKTENYLVSEWHVRS